MDNIYILIIFFKLIVYHTSPFQNFMYSLSCQLIFPTLLAFPFNLRIEDKNSKEKQFVPETIPCSYANDYTEKDLSGGASEALIGYPAFEAYSSSNAAVTFDRLGSVIHLCSFTLN